MTKAVKIITGVLGVATFLAGFNKFFDPSKTNLMIQVTKGELPFPDFTYWLVIFSEQIIGLTLIYLTFFSRKVNNSIKNNLFYLAHLALVVMMLVAIYVHLHPDVPAAALPGKKPFFPIIYMAIVLLNMYLHKKSIKLVK